MRIFQDENKVVLKNGLWARVFQCVLRRIWWNWTLDQGIKAHTKNWEILEETYASGGMIFDHMKGEISLLNCGVDLDLLVLASEPMKCVIKLIFQAIMNRRPRCCFWGCFLLFWAWSVSIESKSYRICGGFFLLCICTKKLCICT
jgi:hypothetical protein